MSVTGNNIILIEKGQLPMFQSNTPVNRHKEVILGVPPSKSNGYRIITINHKNGKSHGSLTKTTQLKQYEKNFVLQCRTYKNKNIDCEFEFYVDVYLPNRRQDLDGVLKVILDSLQTCNAIKNDNLCVKLTAYKFIDKENPRIEFTIKPKQ